MIIRLTHPLISCICITAYRSQFLLKAIICFDTQKYPNRELVISYPKDDDVTKEMVKNIIELSDLNIVVVERNVNTPVGHARNEAIAKCNGEYICTWDDDDWYSERRVADQYNATLTVKQKREASILTNVVLYDKINDEGYISSFYNWGGSLLCKKDIILDYPYDYDNFAEDKQLLSYLVNSKYLHYMPNRADLYTFIYHGENTLHKHHFTYFFKNGEVLNQESKDWLKNLVDRKVDMLSS